MENDVSLSWIRERDIDLLLTAELYNDASFSTWFFEECGFAKIKLLNAKISVTDVYGETDVVVEGVSAKFGKNVILVEHKVGASLQLAQDERYIQRQSYLLSKSENYGVTSVLIAPEAYLRKSVNVFPKVISFEKIITQLKESGRTENYFFIQALETGIRYQKAGYNRIADDDMTTFWKEYYDLVSKDYSFLNMLPPDEKPSGSNFCYFRGTINRKILGKRVTLVHKWPHGNADLQFYSTHPQELRDALELSENMVIAQAAKSASIRISIPKIDSHRSFFEQADNVKEGLDAIKRLFEFSKTI